MNVFHFSGGATSGMMVIKYYVPGDIVIFCDTGREDDDTYRFVNDFIKYTGIPVVCLTGDWRKEVIKYEKVIPNKFKRKCTINLKIRKARLYLWKLGIDTYTQFIGFRSDEKSRVEEYKTRWKRVTTKFPLDTDGTKRNDVYEFWQPYSWRLKIPPILSNCDLCFLKGYIAIMAIIKDCPSKADKWIEDEENKELNPKGYTYHPGTTMRQLRDKALVDDTLPALEDIKPYFNCACTA